MKQSLKSYVKNILKEEFKSKSQQKYFYAKMDDACSKDSSSEECKKWKKYTEEFSKETKDFNSLPLKVDEKDDIKEYVEQNNSYNKNILPKDSKVLSVKKKCQFNNNCFKGDPEAIKIDTIKEYINRLNTKK